MQGSDSAIVAGRGGLFGACSDAIWRNPKMFLLLLLLPPVLWLGIVYIGSLLALLLQSFYSIDEFTGLIQREFTFKTYGELLQPANLDIIVRTVSTATIVTLAAAVVAFPDRLLCRPLCHWQMEGRVLPRRHVALVVQLPGQGICVEAHSCKGGYPKLDACQAAPHLVT